MKLATICPTIKITIPATREVARQPNSSMASTTRKTSNPPTEKPADINPSAIDRFRSNQLTTATTSVTKPAILAPTAIRK